MSIVFDGIELMKANVEALKRRGDRIIVTNGCFDIVHYGHIDLLRRIKNMQGVLIVLVNSDDSVRRIKGEGRPILSIYHRVNWLSELGFIDYIYVFDEDDPGNAIREITPDILAKGGDWDIPDIAGSDHVQDNGGLCCVLPFRYEISTSYIVDCIKASFKI